MKGPPDFSRGPFITMHRFGIVPPLYQPAMPPADHPLQRQTKKQKRLPCYHLRSIPAAFSPTVSAMPVTLAVML